MVERQGLIDFLDDRGDDEGDREERAGPCASQRVAGRYDHQEGYNNSLDGVDSVTMN